MEGEVGASELVESAEDAAALLEPPDAALNDVASSVGVAVEDLVGRVFRYSARDHRLDLVATQPVADPLDVVALVACELVRSVARAAARARQPEGFEDREELLALVTLAGADRDGQGKPTTFANQVELGRETAPGAS